MTAMNIETTNILAYNYYAKHRLTGKKKDATKAVLKLAASNEALKATVKEQQELLVEVADAIETMKELFQANNIEAVKEILNVL